MPIILAMIRVIYAHSNTTGEYYESDLVRWMVIEQVNLSTKFLKELHDLVFLFFFEKIESLFFHASKLKKGIKHI